MNKDYTDITIVLDRSGSMAGDLHETIGGLNSYVDEQKKLPGSCSVSLVQFDTLVETVYSGVPVADVEPRTTGNYIPRGYTALFDAIGRTIVETGERLAALPEEERPGLVCVLIVTDGAENASKDWKLEAVKALIEQQQNEYAWQISFLGAGVDSAAQGLAVGVRDSHVAVYTSETATEMWSANAGSTSRGRSARARGASGQSLFAEVGYTDTERKTMGG